MTAYRTPAALTWLRANGLIVYTSRLVVKPVYTPIIYSLRYMSIAQQQMVLETTRNIHRKLYIIYKNNSIHIVNLHVYVGIFEISNSSQMLERRLWIRILLSLLISESPF